MIEKDYIYMIHKLSFLEKISLKQILLKKYNWILLDANSICETYKSYILYVIYGLETM